MRGRQSRLTLRTLLLAGAVAALAATGPIAAQTNASNEDERQVNQCLDAVRKAGSDPRACVGVVADPCLEAPGNASTQAAIECMSRETVVWTRLLEARYADLAKILNEDGGEQFNSVQRSWTRYRDRRCALGEMLYSGGSLAQVWAATCMLEETGRRAIELVALLDEARAR